MLLLVAVYLLPVARAEAGQVELTSALTLMLTLGQGGDKLNTANSCVVNLTVSLPAASHNGQPNNQPVYIDGLVNQTIHACAGSFVTLTASGGYDCDIEQGTGCSGCIQSSCGSLWTNDNAIYQWSGAGVLTMPADPNDPLGKIQKVQVPLAWNVQTIITVFREQCTKTGGETAANKRAAITIISDEPHRTSKGTSYHASMSAPAMEANWTAVTMNVLLLDDDGPFLEANNDDHHCCNGVVAGWTVPFTDGQIDSTGQTVDYNDINNQTKANNIRALWTGKQAFVAVDHWRPNGVTELPSFTVGPNEAYINPAYGSTVPWVYLHEYGHQRGLADLYCTSNRSSSDPRYPDNFMNVDAGTYVGTDEGGNGGGTWCPLQATRPADGNQCSHLAYSW